MLTWENKGGRLSLTDNYGSLIATVEFLNWRYWVRDSKGVIRHTTENLDRAKAEAEDLAE